MPDKNIVNILLVDDRPENLFALEALLEAPDVNLISANSGNEALHLMLQHDFGLVLLDVQMPEMDGFEVAELMHSSQKTAHIPIIFLTAINKEQRHVVKGYSTGAVDYLFKPIDEVVLRSKVNVFCKMKRYELSQQKMMADLHDANEQLRELDHLKSEFLSIASHELRTPLTIIREFVSLVADDIVGPTTEQQQECLGSALNNCDRLGLLINDLLDLERIEAGESRINRQKNDLTSVLERCRNDFLPRCVAEKQELILEIKQELCPTIFDPELIIQVLVNLIGNAHKFTPTGGNITIRATVIDRYIEISVSDTGRGINSTDHDKIFSKFTQVDRQDGPGLKGTGLGLSIVKKIVDMHDGTISVTSDVGVGTTFMFTLPVYEPELQFQAFLDDKINKEDGTKNDWALLLYRQQTSIDQTNDPVADLEWVDRVISSCLRREEDTTLLIEELPVLAVLAQVDVQKSTALQERLLDAMIAESDECPLIEQVLLTVAKDATGRFEVDLDAVDYVTVETAGMPG